MTLEQKKQKKKDIIRFCLYLISALFIVYFIYDIGKVTSSIDEHIIEQQNQQNDYLNFNKVDKELDLNQELGGKIRKIAFNLLQIIFLTMFIVLLFIYEINDKRREIK